MRTNDAQMLVLCTLADGPLHGYAVNTAIERLTGSRLGRGSLSGALVRLRDKELVEYLDVQGRQRPLQLTTAGRALLEREVRSVAEVAGRMFEATVPDRTAYQDRLAATDTVHSYKASMLGMLALGSGGTVLDLGCGPGIDLGPLAGAVGPYGRVLGIDHDGTAVDRARARTGHLPQVEVVLGDLHSLPLADGSVDGARTDRVLQHVEDPARALAEAYRVLRPGARLVMAEPDWESLSIDHPDLAVVRGYTRHLTDRIVRNGAIGRQLPRLAAAAGFTVPTVTPVPTVFRDLTAADQVLGLQRNTERAVTAGYLTAAQGRSLLDHLAHQPVFASVTLHITTAEVPTAA